MVLASFPPNGHENEQKPIRILSVSHRDSAPSEKYGKPLATEQVAGWKSGGLVIGVSKSMENH